MTTTRRGPRRWGWTATAAATAILVAAALPLQIACASEDREDAVVIGAIYNLTGTQSVLDIPSSEGAILAVEQANLAGGVLDRPVKLVVRDGETVPAVVARQTAALIAEHPTVSALIGLSDTDQLDAAVPVAVKAGIVFLTSGATSPKLPADEREYLYLACFGDNVQAAAAAEWVYSQRGARSVSILSNSTMEYTRLLAGYFETRFTQLGGAIVSRTEYTPDAIGEAIAKLAHADAIFVSAGPADAVAAVPLLRQAGFAEPIIGGDGFDSEAWAKLPAVTDVFFTTHAYLGASNTDPRVIAFRQAFDKAYPGKTPDSFTALGYDAVNLILSAVKRAGSDAPDMVRTALAGTRDLAGVTGTLSYDPDHHIPRKSVAIVAIDRGQYSLAAQFVPSTVPPP
jgi:branched-chain amino acid transport system substrate-binding protein